MLKENYEKYLEILISKYGNPQVKRAEFSEPYYEGDGYEMQAIENNKCSYVAKWKDEIGIAITISIIKRVQIYYKNYLNEIIYEREKLEINKEGF